MLLFQKNMCDKKGVNSLPFCSCIALFCGQSIMCGLHESLPRVKNFVPSALNLHSCQRFRITISTHRATSNQSIRLPRDVNNIDHRQTGHLATGTTEEAVWWQRQITMAASTKLTVALVGGK
jgi:hypothetical protein